jgi:hypothetical protein
MGPPGFPGSAGPAGPQGPQGEQGPAGRPGDCGWVVIGDFGTGCDITRSGPNGPTTGPNDDCQIFMYGECGIFVDTRTTNQDGSDDHIMTIKNLRNVSRYVVGSNQVDFPNTEMQRAQFLTIESALQCALTETQPEECINIFVLDNVVDSNRQIVPYELPNLIQTGNRRVNFIAANFGACPCVVVRGNAVSNGNKCWYGFKFVGSDSEYTMRLGQDQNSSLSDTFQSCEFSNNFKFTIVNLGAIFCDCFFNYQNIQRDALIEIGCGTPVGAVLIKRCRFNLVYTGSSNGVSCFFRSQAGPPAMSQPLVFSLFKDCLFDLSITSAPFVIINIRNQQITEIDGCTFNIITGPGNQGLLYIVGRILLNSEDQPCPPSDDAIYNVKLNITNSTFEGLNPSTSDSIVLLGDLWSISRENDAIIITNCLVKDIILLVFNNAPNITPPGEIGTEPPPVQFVTFTNITYTYEGSQKRTPIQIELQFNWCFVLYINNVFSTYNNSSLSPTITGTPFIRLVSRNYANPPLDQAITEPDQINDFIANSQIFITNSFLRAYNTGFLPCRRNINNTPPQMGTSWLQTFTSPEDPNLSEFNKNITILVECNSCIYGYLGTSSLNPFSQNPDDRQLNYIEIQKAFDLV